MRIGLVGTYDVDNFGDCLFPELYAHLLREALPEASFTLYSPRPKAARILSFDTVRALPARLDQSRQMTEDALILTGGETLGAGHSSGTYNFPRSVLSAYSRLWLAPLHAALTSNGRTRFIVHCVGARKMDPVTNQLAARALKGAVLCTFRDAFSQSWIRDGAGQFGVATDPMFLMDHIQTPDQWAKRRAALLPDGFEKRKGYLVAQLSLGYGGNALDDWCKSVAEIAQARGLDVVLLPICHFLEDEHYLGLARERLQALGVTPHLVGGRINVKDTLSVISGAVGYVGSSLHGAVAAVAFGMPLAVLGHTPDGKHEGTLNSVGIYGCTGTLPNQLPACFTHSETLDLAAVRARAQDQARADFARVLDALTGPLPDTEQKASLEAIDQLVRREQTARQGGASYEVKRFLLRMMQHSGLYSAYGKARARQRIARAAPRHAQRS
ncbi:MAG: polysaccharide pyruvyl transferase family protein [Ruegeria sp.]